MTKSEFRKLMERSRNYAIKMKETTELLCEKIQETFPDLELDEVETGSYNAEDLEQAIECYIQYGEYDIDSLWKELNDAYNNQ